MSKRVPTQKRAKEKYDKILEASFQLFNEKGYYNTTTADIAKEAGVATGSVYAYFDDKKDVYLQVIENLSERFLNPSYEFWKAQTNIDWRDEDSAKQLLKSFILLMIKTHDFSETFHHDFSETFHNEMVALTFLDAEVAELRRQMARRRDANIERIFDTLEVPFKGEIEREAYFHYCFFLIEDLSHNLNFDDDKVKNEFYVEKCTAMLYSLFVECTTYGNEHIK